MVEVAGGIRRLSDIYSQDGISGVLRGILRWGFFRLRNIRIWLGVKVLRLRYGRHVTQKVHGSLLELDLDAAGIHKMLAVFGTRESDSIDYYERRLGEISNGHPSAIVLDIGANIGHYALMAAKNLKDGRVVAIEPDPRNIDRLRNNVRLNGYDNVDCRQAAVGDIPGRTKLNITSESNCNHVSTVDAGSDVIEQIEVEQTTVDDVLADLDVADDLPVILRMDVEGFEGKIVDGAESLLSGSNPVFAFLEVHKPFMGSESYEAMIDTLNEAGLELELAHFQEPYQQVEFITDWEGCKIEDGIGHVFASRRLDYSKPQQGESTTSGWV